MGFLKKYGQFIFGGVVGGLIVYLIMTVILPARQEPSQPQTLGTVATQTPTVVIQPSVAPTTASVTKVSYPAQILNLTNWKITLPVSTEKDSARPLEIKQPELAKYSLDPWFIVNPGGAGVVFRAPVNSPTTSGSKYPRSELREMVNNGKDKASWSSSEGTHTMTIDQAITSTPKVKKHVVAGQIHDDSDDIIVFRLEFPKLHVNVNGKNEKVLDANYTLGKRFSVKFEVNQDKTNVYYNGSSTPDYVLDRSYSNAYFKAGAYTQSNCEREGLADLCRSDNYGEVIIYQTSVTHR